MFNMFPTSLQTHRLLFRPISADDAQAIFDAYAQDPQVTKFLIWRPHRSVKDTEAYIDKCLSATSSRTYVLLGRRDEEIKGAFRLRDLGNNGIACGYVLARAWWGRGLMTEALSEVANWTLNQKNIWRIGAVCDVDNVASAKVMQKAGFEREGLLRRWLIHPNLSDQPRDCYMFSKVK
jgi:RimJ/RimL family protein N-acetyltransferase